MNKKLVFFSALLTLVVFVGITGCYRDDDDNYYYNGSLTFWNEDLNEDIAVTVDGFRTEYIVNNSRTYTCNANGRANYYLDRGWHTYRATSQRNGYTWGPADVYVDEGGCKLVELYR